MDRWRGVNVIVYPPRSVVAMRRQAWWLAAAAMLTVGSGPLGCGSSDSTGPGFESLTTGSGAGGAGGAAASSSSSSTGSSGGTGGSGGAAPELLGAPYPVVLAHGFFGFEDFAGSGFLTYYYGVKDHLAGLGETQIYTPAVDPFNDSTYRGQQLLAHVEAILAETGHAKVNLIGHSQGGLDARVVASLRPDLVASVITLQTPHDGTPIADIALELVQDSTFASVLDFLTQTVGAPLYDQVGNETSLAAALYEFSQPGITAFNQAYPDQPGVFYASIAGRSDWHSGGSACDVANAPSFIADFEDELDPIDPLFAIGEEILDGGILNPDANDGLVRAKDAKRGLFLGCLPADHMDMVGQLLGDQPGLLNDWDYLDFYADLVGYLRDQGF